ncbi:dienelactone hydrolase family protein [Compostibacter hankyongensis]|uniref:Dienelactone hydrolase family protein n=1 Tax=Compostibacter hankyongensis TaxID=1007089 RepID=A0ABP8FIN1_9BACT
MIYAIKTGEQTVDADHSPMTIYTAQPDDGKKHPAVIVVMELFGVNDNIRDITNKIAELGYIAVAPDFYHRTKRPGDIPYGDQGRAYGFEQLNQLTRQHVWTDTDAAIASLKSMPGFNHKIGIVGFSVGGHMAFLAAAKFPFSAVACFYGGWLTNTEIPISRPDPTVTLTKDLVANGSRLIYFAGGKDPHITQDQLEAMETVFETEKLAYQLVVYPGSSHGFFCDRRPDDYNAADHDDAWQRLQEFLSSALK